MFGHDNNDQNTNDQQTSVPEPVADGSLGMNDGAPAAIDEPVHAGAPVVSEPAIPATSPISPVSQAPSAPAGSDTDDLLSIKQQALQQLSPLLGHLDQTPEEKFRTTMMMIQASDDQSLIKTAYEAAQAITDEEARAKALLDIINEINYFTQHNNN